MPGVTGPVPLSAGEAKELFLPLRRQEGLTRVVIACSGGPDSTALLGLYARVLAERGHAEPIAATVDHGLRPESGAEAVAAGQFAARLGIAHRILGWQGEKPRAGLQQAARAARYRLLADLARQTGAQAIVTAHTLDDQAETVLMRLLAGSGPQGLAGMADHSTAEGVALLRPILCVPKARLVATCEAHAWTFARDPSNDNLVFLRPRLRRLMPELANEGLSAGRLSVLANRLRRANAALDALTADWHRRAQTAGRPGYNARVLAEAPAEVQVRFFAGLLAEARAANPTLPAPKLERIERLAGDFGQAVRCGGTFARTLGGLKFDLRDSWLGVRPEPPRRPRSLRQSAANLSRNLGNDAQHP